MAQVQITAPENVARALSEMRFAEIDDYAAKVIALDQLRHVGELVQELAESAEEPSSDAIRELAEMLHGIANTFAEVR